MGYGLRTCARLAVLLGALLTVLALPPLMPAARANFDIDKVERSVVRIFGKGVKEGKQATWSGSGFVVNADGYVATNNHVVEGATTLIVADGSYERLLKAAVVWADPNVDLAVIKVAGLHRPPVPLAVPEPKKGTPVYAVGFPGAGDGMEAAAQRGRPSLDSTVTSGVVGKVFDGSHTNNPATIRRMVQHNAQINPGNSGGPLFNSCNEVVAINTYGKKAILRIMRNPKTGAQVAVGSVPAGIFTGSHVSVLIKNLRARNVAYTPATEICKVSTFLGVAKTPAEMYVYIALAFLVGSAGFVLALRKPRERIVKVVETYSSMLRRKQREAVPQRTGPDTVGGGGGASRAGTAGPAGRPRPSPRPTGTVQKEPAGEPEAGGGRSRPKSGPVSAGGRPGWLLSGFDKDGHSVQILITDSELKRSERGRVIGRKVSLVHHVLSDRTVSRRHARIVATPDGIGVVDLNSTHGTKVSGQEIAPYSEPVPVQPGAEISFGDVTLKVSRQ
jgi:hypothetical protein